MDTYGKLTMIVGTMGSGKTTKLIDLIRKDREAGNLCMVFKPSNYNRYNDGGLLKTHDGMEEAADEVPDADWLYVRVAAQYQPRPKTVYIDEIQFFDPKVTHKINGFLSWGIDVVCAGLDMDFRGEMFGSVPKLLCSAETIIKLRAKCDNCASPWAVRVIRFVNDRPVISGPQILVGGKDVYKSYCRTCASTIFKQHGILE